MVKMMAMSLVTIDIVFKAKFIQEKSIPKKSRFLMLKAKKVNT